MNANTPTPICEECDLEMHRFGYQLPSGWVEGWSCDGCGWSEDDEDCQHPPSNYKMEQEELFNRWKSIGYTFQCLSGIIQNDIKDFPITKADVEEWERMIKKTTNILNELVLNTKFFIDKEGNL